MKKHALITKGTKIELPLTQNFHFRFDIILLSDKDLDKFFGHVSQVPNFRPPFFDLTTECPLLRPPRLQQLGLCRVDPLRNLLKC